MNGSRKNSVAEVALTLENDRGLGWKYYAAGDITIEWWENRRPEFDIYISEFVIVESLKGDTDAAARRFSVIGNIPELTVTEEVYKLAKALVSEGAIPRGSEIDVFHIAVAAVYGIDYLLTWNCVHIANAIIRPAIEATCRNHGFEPPVICTPQELMED